MILEKKIIEYLSPLLSVPVVTETPEDDTASYVRIERVGRAIRNRVTTDSIAFQSYGATMLDAAELDEEVQGCMEGFISLDEISSVTLQSNYNATDTSNLKYRYQCIYDIVYI